MVGGGIIGLEMATVYDALGSKVTVVELLDQLIPGCDPDLVKPLHKRISERYEAIHARHQGRARQGHRRRASRSSSPTGGLETFDRILVAVGRRPNGARGRRRRGRRERRRARASSRSTGSMRTNVPGIYAIGDIVGGPMLAHKATHEGKVAAEVIAGVPGAEFDPRAIPSVAYTDPEVAWMGLTETAARGRRDRVREGGRSRGRRPGARCRWAAPRASTKLLFEPGTERLLGAGIVGVNAGELIAETVHALELGSDAEDIAPDRSTRTPRCPRRSRSRPRWPRARSPT